MKKKTTKDEDGYLVTKEEAVWESFSEDEPEPQKKASFPISSAKEFWPDEEHGWQKWQACWVGQRWRHHELLWQEVVECANEYVEIHCRHARNIKFPLGLSSPCPGVSAPIDASKSIVLRDYSLD